MPAQDSGIDHTFRSVAPDSPHHITNCCITGGDIRVRRRCDFDDFSDLGVTPALEGIGRRFRVSVPEQFQVWIPVRRGSGFVPRYAVNSVPADTPDAMVRTRTSPLRSGGDSASVTSTARGLMNRMT